MSLVLSGSKPKGIEVKTWPIGKDVVYLGDYEITMNDFCQLVNYVLTNRNLMRNDKRVKLVKEIRSITKVKGWGKNGERLEFQDTPKKKKRG